MFLAKEILVFQRVGKIIEVNRVFSGIHRSIDFQQLVSITDLGWETKEGSIAPKWGPVGEAGLIYPTHVPIEVLSLIHI